MKHCDYCGKQNDEIEKTCQGCGTPLPETTPIVAGAIDIPPIIPKPTLNAARATSIFLLMFVAQMFGAMIGGAIVVANAALHGVDISDRRQTVELVNSSPLTMSLAVVASGIATLAVSILLVRPALKDTTPFGAAWVLGSRQDLIKGFCLGFAVALASVIVNTIMSTVIHPTFGPLTKMGLTPGIPQITYLILAILIVPAPEELLFRGVMYGGYRQSFGAQKAAIITTVIFLLMHFTELSHFLPAAIGIAGLALAALHMRLRSSAIGPAVAVHVAYNSVVATLSVLYTAAHPA